MHIDRRQTLAFMGLALIALAVPAGFVRAAVAEDGNVPQHFTEAAFDAAQKAGKPILVDTYATWCQICARQAPIIDKLRSEAKFKDLVIFRVNFDTQKDTMRRLHASVQSTLIAFRGTKEVGRSTGETQPEWVEDLMEKTLPGGSSAS